MAKLQEIHEVRRRYNVDTNISDALTIDDKMRLATKLGLHEVIGFTSATEFNRWAEETKRLRDVLAHGGSVLDQHPDPMKAMQQVLKLYDLADAVI